MSDLPVIPELPGKADPGNVFLRFNPIHRLLIAFTFVAITYLLVRKIVYDPLVMIVVLWDVFCVSILSTAWILFYTCPPAKIRQIASKVDGSRLFVFFIVVICSLASMVIVSLLLFSKISSPEKILYLIVAIGGMLLSWIMVHTTFTFHYAYMYYGDDDETPELHAEGLDFPEEKAPDYIDFAYFAFIIGMTFQVSDVVITSREIRRTALAHSLLAFALNTFVIALTVNLIAGLKG
ncbi:MAG: DUF1345 domain-containing protein [Bacteroidota bacterium]